MNRRRIVALGAVVLFAGAIVGIAVAAGGGGRSSPALAKLPIGATSSEASASGTGPAVAQPIAAPEYQLKGPLPTLPTVAPAYQVSSTVTSADASRLASAIGLHGSVDSTGGEFVVADGTRRLVVPNAAGAAWFFQDQPANADCPPGAMCATASAGSVVAASPCSPPPCPPDHGCAASCGAPAPPPAKPADLPAQAQATQLGKAFLTKAGVDVEHANLATHDLFDAWSVTADPVVGGLPVLGFEASATVGPKGVITQASGHLGQVTKAGDYPLAGTDVGFSRLQNGMVAVFGGPRPLSAVAPSGEPASVSAADQPVPGQVVPAPPPAPLPPAPPPDPDPACLAKFHGPCPPTTIVPVAPPAVTITGVQLALAMVRSPDPAKSVLLVPVYVFETGTGDNLPPVPAVVDRLLQLPAVAPAGSPPATR